MAVYLIRNETSGLVKIGHASDHAKRLSSFQTGSGDTLRLLRLLDGGRSEEIALHQRFKHRKKRGEWFDITDNDVFLDFGINDLPLPKRTTTGGGLGPGRPMLGDRPLTAAERQARRREKLADLLVQAGGMLREFPDGTKQKSLGVEIDNALRHRTK